MRLVVFDLDHTLLTVNSSFRFGAFLYSKEVYSFWILMGCLSDYVRYKWMRMSIDDLHHKIFIRLFKGLPIADIRRYALEFISGSLDKMLYSPVLKRFKEAQAQGDRVVILSASPDFLVEEIANYLGVDDWRATSYLADEQGRLEAISQVMEGENKANYLKKLSEKMQIAQSAITVYSDSHLDLPILKMAGQAIGVRPDWVLKKICLKNRWEIL